jgi:hypothetical protein
MNIGGYHRVSVFERFMSLRFKLPQDVVTNLDSYTAQAGIERPLLVAALVADFLGDKVPDPSRHLLGTLIPSETNTTQSSQEVRHVRLAHISPEDETKLRDWAARMAMTPSTLMEAIIRDRFSDRSRLEAIVGKAKAEGYQTQLRIPEIDTSENARIGVVAMLSPELRTAIEAQERLWSRTTTQQIEHMLAEAVEKQDKFDGPLSSPPSKGSERKLVRLPRDVHAKLAAWSIRENRTLQNHIVHVLHKAVAE